MDEWDRGELEEQSDDWGVRGVVTFSNVLGVPPDGAFSEAGGKDICL